MSCSDVDVIRCVAIPTATDIRESAICPLLPFLSSNSPVIIRFHDNTWWTPLLAKVEELLQCDIDLNQNINREEEYGGASVVVPVDFVSKEDIGICTRKCIPIREFKDLVLGSALASNTQYYAKDWHIDRHSWAQNAYSVPLCFQDDWLNWYWKRVRQSDDYAFVYMGGPRSVTGMHHDVCCSYSWSLNMSGNKKWTLFAPSDTHCLFSTKSDDRTFNCNDSMCADTRPGRFDDCQYPLLRNARKFECIQEEGDCIFVPSGWYHMVENMDNTDTHHPHPQLTISLNRNWLNAFCLSENYLFCVRELLAVEHEIVHLLAFEAVSGTAMTMCLSEWLQQCSLLLKANSAMGVVDLVGLLLCRLLYINNYWQETCSRQHSMAFGEVLQRYLAETPPLTSEDRQLFAVQRRLTVQCTPTRDKRHSLSQFAVASSGLIHNAPSHCQSGLQTIAAFLQSLSPLLSCNSSQQGLPVSLWTHSILQIRDVLLDMATDLTMLLHLGFGIMQHPPSPREAELWRCLLDANGDNEFLQLSAVYVAAGRAAVEEGLELASCLLQSS